MDSALRALTDRLDVADVLARYCTALDARDWDGLRDVFLATASCDYGALGSPAGVGEIIQLVRGTIGDLDATQHHVANVVVEVSGDVATATCSLISQHIRGDRHYLLGGLYGDRLVRTPAGWRIEHRTLTRLWSTGDRDIIRRPTSESAPQ
jgi:hypothetical protein